MTTVIAVYDSDGCVGRCDAKCHYASSRFCDCICGGRLHGTKAHAVERNTRDLLGDDLTAQLQAFADRNELRIAAALERIAVALERLAASGEVQR